jgi:hypothetical protein
MSIVQKSLNFMLSYIDMLKQEEECILNIVFLMSNVLMTFQLIVSICIEACLYYPDIDTSSRVSIML